MENIDHSSLAQCLALMKIPELIYILTVSFTMLSVDGKLFWVINLVCVILKLNLLMLYCILKDKPVSTLIASDIVISFMIFCETIMHALDTFYALSAFGYFVANIVGIVFVLFYGSMLYAITAKID